MTGRRVRSKTEFLDPSAVQEPTNTCTPALAAGRETRPSRPRVRPSWLVPAPWIPKWRSLPYLAPALSHGAKLSCAWIPGALAAKAYEREAYDGSVNEAVKRTVKAGCFAIGILILATQTQLSVEFAARGLPPPQLGDSPETDLVLNGVASELIADSVFEAVGLIAWRIVRCTTDIPPDEEQWF